MKFLYILFFCLILSFVSCQKLVPNRTQLLVNNELLATKLDSLIVAENQANRFDGTVLVAQKDRIVFSKAIGKANRVWEIPMQLDYRFDIASLNKSFIAVLILKAVEEQKLHLEDKLIAYFPQLAKPFHADITLHHLLCHISGIPDYQAVQKNDESLIKNNFLAFKRLHFNNEEYADFISRLEASPPNQQFYYSNFAYHLLAIILEKTYQQPFADLLQEKICQPLGLKYTFSEAINQVVHLKVVEAYNFQETTQTYKSNNFIDFSLGRKIFSSVIDLHKWALAMQDSSFLTKKSLELIKTNHIKELNSDISYGYGWVVFDGKRNYKMGNLGIQQPYLIHGGSTEGYKSLLTIIEDGKWIITHLSNIGNQTNEILLTQKIIKLLK